MTDVSFKTYKIIPLFMVFFFSFLFSCTNKSTPKKIANDSKDSASELYAAFEDLMKFPDSAAANEIEFEYQDSEKYDNHIQYRLQYSSNGEKVPGYLLIPDNISPPYPVMICLQGHAPGMYISMGKYNNEREKKLVEGGRDLALQSLENGWAALVIEQKGFGERQKDSLSCNHQSLQELLEGRSMLGQRVYDISRAIDMIHAQDSLDNSQIGIIGNSSGGTTGYYAAAMDERIDLAVVSCSFSTFETSWLKYPHCACGYLPGLLEIADMPDLTELITPRNLIIVAGDEDYLADIEGVKEGFATAEKWYSAQNASENLKLIVGDGGHRFYPNQTWPIIQEMKQKLARK